MPRGCAVHFLPYAFFGAQSKHTGAPDSVVMNVDNASPSRDGRRPGPIVNSEFGEDILNMNPFLRLQSLGNFPSNRNTASGQRKHNHVRRQLMLGEFRKKDWQKPRAAYDADPIDSAMIDLGCSDAHLEVISNLGPSG